MISPQNQDLLNAQLNREYSSSYAYLAMAAYAESLSLLGFASWLRVQHREELEHALKFYEYIHAQNGRVTLAAIDQPRAEYGSIVEVFAKKTAATPANVLATGRARLRVYDRVTQGEG